MYYLGMTNNEVATTTTATIGNALNRSTIEIVEVAGHAFIVDGMRIMSACRKCGMTGIVEAHMNVMGGQCFACHGTGHGRTVNGTVDQLPAIAKRRNAANARARAKRNAEQAVRADRAAITWQAKIDAWHAEALEIDAQRSTQHYIGAIGQEITVAATVTFVRACETRFGVSWLIVADNGAGATVKMFSSSRVARQITVGQTITIMGEVKAHEEYDNKLQTIIARPKFL
jgi:hypothetical protein